MHTKKPRIILAAGGTGGHLFPAQTVADDLTKRQRQAEVLFVASGLKTSRFFEKDRFPYKEISSATPFGKNLRSFFPSVLSLLKGVWQSLDILTEFKPDLVVGFGSFHSFPMLCAALFKRVPILLFESNAEPGKVNRFFSRWAKISAIHFPETATRLKGQTAEVAMPLKKQWQKASLEEARGYFLLRTDLLTFLVFGGSQGAAAINRGVSEAFAAIAQKGIPFQVIHFAGNAKSAEEVRQVYHKAGIPAEVKEFEQKMDLAWSAADLAICRCGAGTVAEQINFEVPGILIPYPYAYEHQSQNGRFMADKVGGAILFQESDLKVPDAIKKTIESLIDPKDNRLSAMRSAIAKFKRSRKQETLADLVLKMVGGGL